MNAKSKPSHKHFAMTLVAVAASALSSNYALAAQECGPIDPNAPSVTCSSASYPAGINYYTNDVGSLTLDNLSLTVSVHGIISGPRNGTRSTSVIANQFSLVNTSALGFWGRGLMATSTGDATVTAKGGEVKTSGNPDSDTNTAIGVLAEVLGPGSGNALVVLDGTTVTTLGISSYGVMSYNGFGGATSGSATIKNTNAVVSTSGAKATGLHVGSFSAGNTAPVSATVTGGSVKTTGDGAIGINAFTQGSGPVTVTIDNNATVTTQGGSSDALSATSTIGLVNVQVNSGSVTATGTGTDAIHVVAGTTATVTNQGTLSSTSGDGIDVTGAAGGAMITSSGNITANGSGAAVVRGSAAADTFTATGGALKGVTLMGAGDDIVTLKGTVDTSGAAQFDGGAGNDTLNIDGMTLRGFTAAANNPALGSNLTLWETVDVENAGTLRLTGDLFAATNTGALKLSSSGSTLDLQDAATATSTVNGNFDSSGQLKLDTVVGDSSSKSDVLRITGNTSGSTVVQINNLGGTGALTAGNGILLVQVDGSSAGAFTLPGGSLVAGNYIYTLKQVGKNWYLQSQLNVGTQPTLPTPVPSLGQWALAVLSLILGGLAAVGLGRSRLR